MEMGTPNLMVISLTDLAYFFFPFKCQVFTWRTNPWRATQAWLHSRFFVLFQGCLRMRQDWHQKWDIDYMCFHIFNYSFTSLLQQHCFSSLLLFHGHWGVSFIFEWIQSKRSCDAGWHEANTTNKELFVVAVNKYCCCLNISLENVPEVLFTSSIIVKPQWNWSKPQY